MTDDTLTIEITDDGRGGADPAKGSGLRGMADRLDRARRHAHRGEPAGNGTRITGVIPCAS